MHGSSQRLFEVFAKVNEPSFPLVSEVAHEFLSSMHLSHYFET